LIQGIYHRAFKSLPLQAGYLPRDFIIHLFTLLSLPAFQCPAGALKLKQPHGDILEEPSFISSGRLA